MHFGFCVWVDEKKCIELSMPTITISPISSDLSLNWLHWKHGNILHWNIKSFCVCNEFDERNTLLFSFAELRLRNNHFAQFWIPCVLRCLSFTLIFLWFVFLSIWDLPFFSLSRSLSLWPLAWNKNNFIHSFNLAHTFRFWINRNTQKKSSFENTLGSIIFDRQLYTDISIVRYRFVAVSSFFSRLSLTSSPSSSPFFLKSMSAPQMWAG